MNVLITGATGFIGRHICAGLIARGHKVVAAVRDPSSALRRFPGIDVACIDMNTMVSPADWAPLLKAVDAVVNCAGILQSTRTQSAQAIHANSPNALFDACVMCGVQRVVQISAVSADSAVGTEFALTKKSADDHLRGLNLDWIVLRPSLVYAQGSFGGTSLLRGLAGLPFVMPLPGDGHQQFQPIHADDLAETVCRCIEDPELARRTLDPVGPGTLTTRDILERTRCWLDIAPVHALNVPLPLMRVFARIADIFDVGPMRTTALKQLEYGNVSDPGAFETAIRFRPRTMAEAFLAQPSHVQDRWHARLYFLKPALTLTLSMVWIGSGLVGLLVHGSARATGLPAVIGDDMARTAASMFGVLDIGVGLALLAGIARKVLGLVQLALIAGYTVILGILLPELWADFLGGLLKNIPLMATVAIWMALQDEK